MVLLVTSWKEMVQTRKGYCEFVSFVAVLFCLQMRFQIVRCIM